MSIPHFPKARSAISAYVRFQVNPKFKRRNLGIRIPCFEFLASSSRGNLEISVLRYPHIADVGWTRSMADAADDSDIVGLLRARDEAGLQILRQRYTGLVLSVLANQFRNGLASPEIDDAFSNAITKCWIKFDQFDSSRGEFRNWFIKIALREAQQIVRRERKHRVVHLDNHMTQHAADSRHDLGDPLQNQQEGVNGRLVCDLKSVILRLPMAQREIIQADLRAGGAEDASELAARFKKSRQTIYTLRSQARTRIRKDLNSMGYFLQTSDDDDQ